MYDQSSILIASVLFACILFAIEAGFRIGRRRRATVSASIKSQINSIQAAALGVLALLLGFSFSLALQRHDNRSQAVVDEANAIGTAYLRSQLLPADMRDPAGALLREYLDLRIRASSVTLADPGIRAPLLQQAGRITEQLWVYARQAAEQDGGPVTSGLFIQSLNDLIDSHGRRDAALGRHVPELVLYLLFVAFVMTGSILGYVSGIERDRVTFPTFIMVGLIVLLVFLIIDLDRPRRGFIQVNQKSLEDLQQTITSSRNARPDVTPGSQLAPRQ